MGVSCKRLTPVRSRHRELHTKLETLVSNHDFWGTILLAQGGSTIFSAARGFSDTHASAIRLSDGFVIGSISKQITAAIVLREYEKGTLRLEDPVGQFLPDLPKSWANLVTIHHLLVHTHGIYDLEQAPRFEVGARFEYSQLGYHLLARVVETIRRASFARICTELFTSLGLSKTCHPENLKPQALVQGFERRKPGSYHRCEDSLNNYAAAGSLISTASDLVRWNQLLHSGVVVSQGTLESMATRHATREHPIFDKVEYGYGLIFKKSEHRLQIGALGYAPGFASACYHYPKQNMNLVLLCNRVDLSKDFRAAFRVHLQAMKLVRAAQEHPLGH